MPANRKPLIVVRSLFFSGFLVWPENSAMTRHVLVMQNVPTGSRRKCPSEQEEIRCGLLRNDLRQCTGCPNNSPRTHRLTLTPFAYSSTRAAAVIYSLRQRRFVGVRFAVAGRQCTSCSNQLIGDPDGSRPTILGFT